MDYEEYLCLGKYIFEDGTIVGGQLGKTDIVNRSSANIKYYSVNYKPRSSPSFY